MTTTSLPEKEFPNILLLIGALLLPLVFGWLIVARPKYSNTMRSLVGAGMGLEFFFFVHEIVKELGPIRAAIHLL